MKLQKLLGLQHFLTGLAPQITAKSAGIRLKFTQLQGECFSANNTVLFGWAGDLPTPPCVNFITALCCFQHHDGHKAVTIDLFLIAVM